MSINYIVGDVEKFDQLPNGWHSGIIDFVEGKMWGYENPYEVIEVRFIAEDDEIYGQRHTQRYSIGHPENYIRKININSFNQLCQDVGGMKKGDEFKEELLLYKKVFFLTQQKPSKKDGTPWANVVKCILATPDISLESLNKDLYPVNIANMLSKHTPQKPVSSVSQPVSHETHVQPQQTGIVPPIANTLTNIALNDEVPF